MHISFGTPLISAEHEPHLPALQLSVGAAPGYRVHFAEVRAVLPRIVVAKLGAAAFLADQGGAGDRLGYRQQAVQVDGGVPAGVEFAVAGRPRFLFALTEFRES